MTDRDRDEPLDDFELRLECLAMAYSCAGPNTGRVLAVARQFADFVFGYDPDRFDGPDEEGDQPDPSPPPPISGPELTDEQRAKILRVFSVC